MDPLRYSIPADLLTPFLPVIAALDAGAVEEPSGVLGAAARRDLYVHAHPEHRRAAVGQCRAGAGSLDHQRHRHRDPDATARHL